MGQTCRSDSNVGSHVSQAARPLQNVCAPAPQGEICAERIPPITARRTSHVRHQTERSAPVRQTADTQSPPQPRRSAATRCNGWKKTCGRRIAVQAWWPCCLHSLWFSGDQKTITLAEHDFLTIAIRAPGKKPPLPRQVPRSQIPERFQKLRTET